MRVPRPPSEPGKGSYWKLDPNHQSPLDQAHNGGSGGGGSSRANRSTRRATTGQRGPSRSSRRATSDPTPHQLPAGSEIPLTPVPVLPKRPGQENDPYVFKIDTPAAPTIIPTLSTTSAANRRHSHLLSHDHSYTSPQEQLQHIEQQQQQQHGSYAMTSSFNLSGLNTQHHHGALFSPTSPTATSPTGEYGGSFYSTNGGTPSHALSPGMMDSDSSFSRFSGTGLFYPQNGGNASGAIPSTGRPLSMPGSTPYGTGSTSHYSDYTHGNQHPGSAPHSYGHMSQPGGTASPFYAGSVNYGFSPPSRPGVNGGANTQSYGSPPYRGFHDYSNTGSPDYSGGHSRQSSMMSLSPPGSSFMSAASSPPPTSYSTLSQQSFGQAGSGMLSPVSPGGHSASSAMSISASSPPPSVTSSMRVGVSQDSKGLSGSVGGTNANGTRSHTGW